MAAVGRDLGTALLLSILLMSAGAPAGAVEGTVPGAWKSVGYQGLTLDVPADWPVYDLAREPTRCVRLDSRAVYLGRPGASQDCPSRQVGRTDTVIVEPADPSSQAFRRATRTALVGGQPVHTDPAAATSHSLVTVFDRPAVQVSVSYGADSALARHILGGLRAAGAGAAVRPAAGAAPGAQPQAAAAGPAAGLYGGVYEGPGFDTCAAPAGGVMQAWLSSPYRALGVYVGGANVACAQPNLTASWVSAMTGIGWSLVPQYVGLQAPCATQAGLAPIDPGSARAQGAQAGDDAVARTAAFGFPPGTPILLDMEHYGSGCSAAVLAFIDGYDAQVHAHGYAAGLYESASNIPDLLASAIVKPDQLFYAHWDGRAVTAGDAYVPDSAFSNHQRIHQYLGGHLETWSGLTINVDSDQFDATLGGSGPQTGAVRTVTYPVPGRGTNVAVFGRGVDGTVQERYFDSGAWSPWISLGGSAVGEPAVVVDEPSNRVQLFIRGIDNAVWERHWTPAGWTARWVSLGGTIKGAPTAVADDGSIRVYARAAADSSLWERQWTSAAGWTSNWSGLGGRLASDPSVIVNGTDVNLFTTGVEGGVWEKYHTPGGGWTPDWIGLGGLVAGPVTALADHGNVELYARAAADSSLWERYWTPAGWAPRWISLGGHLAADPAVIVNGTDVAVFARGLEGGVWEKFWTPAGGWSPTWIGLGSSIAEGPTALFDHATVEVYVRAAGDGSLWTRSWTQAAGWTPRWTDLGGSLT